MSATNPITHGPRKLQAFTEQQPPTYQRFYKAVLDGRIPAHQIDGKWYFHDADLHEIAAAFGLSPAGRASEPVAA